MSTVSNSVEQCRTVSTVSTVSTVIAWCYLHLRWYFFEDFPFTHHPPTMWAISNYTATGCFQYYFNELFLPHHSYLHYSQTIIPNDSPLFFVQNFVPDLSTCSGFYKLACQINILVVSFLLFTNCRTRHHFCL